MIHIPHLHLWQDIQTHPVWVSPLPSCVCLLPLLGGIVLNDYVSSCQLIVLLDCIPCLSLSQWSTSSVCSSVTYLLFVLSVILVFHFHPLGLLVPSDSLLLCVGFGDCLSVIVIVAPYPSRPLPVLFGFAFGSLFCLHHIHASIPSPLFPSPLPHVANPFALPLLSFLSQSVLLSVSHVFCPPLSFRCSAV